MKVKVLKYFTLGRSEGMIDAEPGMEIELEDHIARDFVQAGFVEVIK